MALAHADAAQEDDVGLLGQELQAEEILDLEPVDFLGPAPVELFEGFQDGEPGAFDPRLHAALELVVVLALDEAAQVFEVRGEQGGFGFHGFDLGS